MSERKREDKDFQDVAFSLAKILHSIADKKNPLIDFSNTRSMLKRSALRKRTEGLINQNPTRRDTQT